MQFKPAWWLQGPHLQTLWPSLFRRIPDLTFRRDRRELPDGDFLDLDWVGETGRPIVLLLHGLEGSSRSPYMQGMLSVIQACNWQGVALNFRSCSGEPNRLPRIYHSGDTADLDFIVRQIKKEHPYTPLAAVGFSLGGNVLLKWLGETGHLNPFSAAVGVSVPFELHKVARRIQNGFSRLYQWHLLRNLKWKIAWKFGKSPPISLKNLREIQSIWDFDEKITAPLHGFQDAEDYYQQSSCRPFLKNIQVPTLLLQAADDPFMTPDLVPSKNELSKVIQLELTPSGGHVGFVGGFLPWKAHYWLEERVVVYLNSIFTSCEKAGSGGRACITSGGRA